MSATAHRHAAAKTRPALVAGAVAGAAGLLVFLVIHHVWIMPIWFILPPGLAIAGVGGLAIGWAYGELEHRLPARPWRHVAWVCLVALTLAPSVALAELRPALFDADTGELRPGTDLMTVATRFGAELLLPAALVGALVGWRLAGRRAAWITGLAGFVLALGPGHNIPLLGGTAGAAKGAILLASIVVVSTFVLVETHARLSRRS
ncbi:hypothetical protein DVA67_007760 [Solirubrobacter sp. CPCC 204708]|uniref:Uncharacterized protein n=1 Tax=Solirubrobacter deserti TaxID=2282478 RepID=A0ABT4RJS1_9ACTN|nr:hypothetical protein [Solirubrobacter deserti]MBE2315867.1 hypothetical protein [Solirubrobacter deserti]MDA0138795.1 hypothetical protein [Solirubrobacter deserti]